MIHELTALEANIAWEIVPVRLDKKVVGYKRLYKIKYNPDGAIGRYKYRVVLKGFTQTADLDYLETFSPMVKVTTV